MFAHLGESNMNKRGQECVCVCACGGGGERGCKGRRAKSLEFVTSSVQSSKPLPCVKRRIYNKSIAVRVISTI